MQRGLNPYYVVTKKSLLRRYLSLPSLVAQLTSFRQELALGGLCPAQTRVLFSLSRIVKS